MNNIHVLSHNNIIQCYVYIYIYILVYTSIPTQVFFKGLSAVCVHRSHAAKLSFLQLAYSKLLLSAPVIKTSLQGSSFCLVKYVHLRTPVMWWSSIAFQRFSVVNLEISKVILKHVHFCAIYLYFTLPIHNFFRNSFLSRLVHFNLICS